MTGKRTNIFYFAMLCLIAFAGLTCALIGIPMLFSLSPEKFFEYLSVYESLGPWFYVLLILLPVGQLCLSWPYLRGTKRTTDINKEKKALK